MYKGFKYEYQTSPDISPTLHLVIHHTLVSKHLTLIESQLYFTARCENKDSQLTVGIWPELSKD